MRIQLGRQHLTYREPKVISRIGLLLFNRMLLVSLCVAMGCKQEVRVLGDGLENRTDQGPFCSNAVKDAVIPWRRSSTNETPGMLCQMGECILLAEGTLLDENGWFYRVRIEGPGEGLSFFSGKVGRSEFDNSMATSGDLFFPDGSPEEISNSDDHSISDFTYLISIFSKQISEQDNPDPVAVVAVNRTSQTHPFFRLQAYRNNFWDEMLLVQVDDRIVVEMTHDNEGNIIVITHRINQTEPYILDDLRIAKYDPTGNLIWDKPVTGNASHIHGLVCDSHNSILIASDQMSSPDSSSGEPGIESKLWLFKLDKTGELIWEKEIADVGSAIFVIDKNDNLILSAIDYIYNRSEGSRFRSFESYDLWMSLFAADGEPLWEFKTEILSKEFSLTNPASDLSILHSNKVSMVTDRDGSIYFAQPILNRKGVGPNESLLVQFTPLGKLCAARYIDEAPIELFLSQNDELYFDGKYSFGQISRD